MGRCITKLHIILLWVGNSNYNGTAIFLTTIKNNQSFRINFFLGVLKKKRWKACHRALSRYKLCSSYISFSLIVEDDTMYFYLKVFWRVFSWFIIRPLRFSRVWSPRKRMAQTCQPLIWKGFTFSVWCGVLARCWSWTIVPRWRNLQEQILNLICLPSLRDPRIQSLNFSSMKQVVCNFWRVNVLRSVTRRGTLVSEEVPRK